MTRQLTAAAVCAYAAVIVALTTLKAFFRIGYLWDPANQRVRELQLEPLVTLRDANSWFGPAFEYGGNVAFFVPLGMLLWVFFDAKRQQSTNKWRTVLLVTVVGFLFSVGIETAQYIFELGRTSTDDVVCNTLGAFIGAGFALLCGPRWHKVWVWLALVLAVVFAVLVGLGERLGDPDKVVDL